MADKTINERIGKPFGNAKPKEGEPARKTYHKVQADETDADTIKKKDEQEQRLQEIERHLMRKHAPLRPDGEQEESPKETYSSYE